MRTVFHKELLDHWRDRRSVLGAMVLPIAGPLILLLMFTFLAQLQKETPLEVPVEGAARAPRLMAFLKQRGVRVLPPVQQPRVALHEGDVQMVLVIDEAFAEDFRAGRTAKTRLLVDDSRPQGRKNVRRLQGMLASYAQGLGALRLLARGVSPAVASPLGLERVDVATPEETGASLLNIIPLFLMLAALVGGMNLAIDSTAGERERGSLEPLLLNPVSRYLLVAGKWAATVVASMGVTLVAQLAFWAIIRFVPLEELGVKVSFGIGEAAVMFVAVLPLAFFGAALQMLIATFARSFKEAQTYLNLLNLIPVVPSMLLMLYPERSQPWMMWVPTLAQVNTVVDVLRGSVITPTRLLAIWGSSLAYSALCLGLLVHFLSREKIVFGRS